MESKALNSSIGYYGSAGNHYPSMAVGGTAAISAFQKLRDARCLAGDVSVAVRDLSSRLLGANDIIDKTADGCAPSMIEAGVFESVSQDAETIQECLRDIRSQIERINAAL